MSPKNNPEHQEEIKARILQAAKSIFTEKGFHAASMTGIAKRAGVSPAHLYNFYENKAALALEVQKKMSRETFEMLTEAMRAAEGDGSVLPKGLFDPRKASLTITVMTEAARNPEIARQLVENGNKLRSIMMEHYGITEEDTERRFRLELSLCLFLGLSIRSIFSDLLDSNELKKLLMATNRWLMDNESCSEKLIHRDK